MNKQWYNKKFGKQKGYSLILDKLEQIATQ